MEPQGHVEAEKPESSHVKNDINNIDVHLLYAEHIRQTYAS